MGQLIKKATIGLEYLYSLSPWKGTGGFSLHPIREVLGRLGDPQDALPTVHVAGTNGKGSVSSTIASILGRAGYRVGLNTSPHLERINERFVVDGVEASDEFLGEFAYEIKAAASRAVTTLTFHEAITALAFLGFREFGVEWNVIEVGLGGRLDASNVIKRPVASVIVTIDYDHQHILGDTIFKIASEKAGIIKPGAPLITGNLPIDAQRAIEGVLHRSPGATHLRFGRDFDIRRSNAGGEGVFEYWNKSAVLPLGENILLRPSLKGMHQAHNVAVAATTALTIGIPPERCKEGVESVFWPARLEEVSINRRVMILDCAHNPAGIKTLTSFLDRRGWSRVDVVFGVLDTKSWEEMVSLLSPIVKTWRLLLPQSERALDQGVLRERILASCADVSVHTYGSDYERCVRDLTQNEEGPFVIVGSMYMVGKIRSMLGIPKKPLWQKT